MNRRLLSRELNNLESDWGLFLYENEGEIYLYVEQTRADRNPKFFCHIVVSLSCHVVHSQDHGAILSVEVQVV